MKKAIPVFVAIFLILIIGGVTFGSKLYEKYSYSQEEADLNEYYHLYSDTDMAIILKDTIVPEHARYVDGEVYFDLDTVHKYFNERFYADVKEQLLLYTMPTYVIRTTFGTSQYSYTDENQQPVDNTTDYKISYYEDDTLYIAADYVAQYTDLHYDPYTDPNRVWIDTQESERTEGTINKNTAVRLRGGVKSAILTKREAGEQVIVLEQMDEWSKVQTIDGFIGYVENKRLDNVGPVAIDYASDFTEPVFTNIKRDYKINMVWQQFWSAQDGSYLREGLKGTSGINVVSPTVFFLSDNQGNILNIANKNYVDTAHDMGLEVWALVSNVDEPSADVNSKELLSSTTARNTLCSNLIAAVEEYGFDGINVDFEQVNMQAGEDYIQFIRELSVVCRNKGIVLSVDNYVPTEYTAHYNRTEQGIWADYVIIMGYDEHYAGSGAGSVASIGYVSKGIADTVALVPEEKVINALPFYTRVWKTQGGNVTCESVGMNTAQNILTQNGVTPVWSDEVCQNYGEYESGDTLCQIWLEDGESIQAKLGVMSQYNLAGVAGWKLGLQADYVWDLLAAYLAQ